MPESIFIEMLAAMDGGSVLEFSLPFVQRLKSLFDGLRPPQ